MCRSGPAAPRTEAGRTHRRTLSGLGEARSAVSPSPVPAVDDHGPIGGLPPLALWAELAYAPCRRLCVSRQTWKGGLVRVGQHTLRTPGSDPGMRPAGCDLAAGDDELRGDPLGRSEEHTSELQSLAYLVCRLLLEKKKKKHEEMNIQ